MAIFLSIIPVLSFSAGAQEKVNWAVQVLAYKNDKLLNQVSGFLAGAPKVVLTTQHITLGADQIRIRLENGQELDAKILPQEVSPEIAVLKVIGKLPSSGFISIALPERGEPIRLQGFWSVGKEAKRDNSSDGFPAFQAVIQSASSEAIGLTQTIKDKNFTFTATAGRGAYGAPVLNRCGEILGMYLPSAGASQTTLWSLQTPSPVMSSMSPKTITQILSNLGVTPKTAAAKCEYSSAAVKENKAETNKAILKAKEAEKKADKASEQANKAKKKAEEAEKQAEKAKKEADKAEQRRLESQENAAKVTETLAGDLEKKNDEINQFEALLSEYKLYILFGGGIAASIVVLLMILAGRRKTELVRREHQVADLTAPVPDLSLVGVGSDGTPIAVKISGKALKQAPDGLFIGRNPASCQIVIADKTVSRTHAKIRQEGDTFLVEDFGSAGGTEIDGTVVSAGTSLPLPHGSTLTIGGAKLKLTAE
ncbi:MAG: FHA domain-containing protein [Sneathiella sp.]